ncbi:endolytic transglycosylase MltG [Pseudonocardia sp.]|uniref:endolytic transglycosylase MltG n=1 Tax=Pseudonocardia sp. TaxID=60912 RepID=UPI003D0B5448
MTRTVDVSPERRDAARRPVDERRRRVRLLMLSVAVLLLGGVLVAVGPALLGPPDYEGTGTGTVVVEVRDGATTTQIGAAMQRADVVKSTEAFTDAALDEPRIRSVQPGFYAMRAQMSGAAAVELLLDPASRVGRLEIRSGVQLDDTRSPDGTVTPGALTLLSRATCTSRDGVQQCVSPDELRAAMADTDPETLGVPTWARADVLEADPRRRLEGLMLPGIYDVAPGASAEDALRTVVTASAERLEASGIVAGARAIGYRPYAVLTVASLVEKEGIIADMPKVARVIYNRLDAGQRLELDSTVNYPLDIQALRTSAEARAQDGPYNSYRRPGLPPTPISAPGKDALAAALEPADGTWRFFVRCQTDGTSCFGDTLAEHQANVRKAVANGAF